MAHGIPSRFHHCFNAYSLISLVCFSQPLFAQPAFPLTPGQQAEASFLQKRYEDSIRLYTQIIEDGEGDSHAFRGLIKAYAAAERLADAEEFLKSYISSHPESSPAFYAYGYMLYLRDQDGEESLAKALSLDPANSLALNNMGAVLARKKLFPKAIEMVKKAISINPTELFFYQNLKSIYRALGKPDLFVDEYREYLLSGPASVAEGYGKTIATGLRQEGFKLYSQQKVAEAISAFSRMHQVYLEIRNVTGVVAALFSLGLLYEETGDIKNAEKYYREVLEINPGHIQAREKIKDFH